MTELMLSVKVAFAEFERSLIKERQRVGIAIAKAKGAYKGRKERLSSDQLKVLFTKDQSNGGKAPAGLPREFGISRETLYQYLKTAALLN